MLTQQQAESALLTSDDLGSDFERFWFDSSGPTSAEPEASADNCLDAALGAIGPGHEAAAEAEYSSMSRAERRDAHRGTDPNGNPLRQGTVRV